MMKEPTYIVILITTSGEKEARAIADLLLNRRKAACVNILPRVDSLFWWQGGLESAQESLMVIKAKAFLLPEIINLVKGVHSYQVPEIIAVPIIAGNEDYLRWIDGEVEG
jgi:periplasmic divalent cation tolerance protein